MPITHEDFPGGSLKMKIEVDSSEVDELAAKLDALPRPMSPTTRATLAANGLDLAAMLSIGAAVVFGYVALVIVGILLWKWADHWKVEVGVRRERERGQTAALQRLQAQFDEVKSQLVVLEAKAHDAARSLYGFGSTLPKMEFLDPDAVDELTAGDRITGELVSITADPFDTWLEQIRAQLHEDDAGDEGVLAPLWAPVDWEYAHAANFGIVSHSRDLAEVRAALLRICVLAIQQLRAYDTHHPEVAEPAAS